ncbi:hypothetical protein E6C27_scaffold274G001710 [Cucumis melo var. makuwa]|uniref:Uncharacterized protein n=1 Tax=Cucumis melo var. makuwa TaxID=1194695 RepID=A0A5A7UPS6_CUCMM|nr:hypothetical protein E6C27_scaffold274G001710 [Cucumis melo var. makuwa]
MFLKLESWKKACIFEEASIFEGVLEVEDLEENLDIQRSFNLRSWSLGRKFVSSKELQSSRVFLKLESWKKVCIFKEAQSSVVGVSIFESSLVGFYGLEPVLVHGPYPWAQSHGFGSNSAVNDPTSTGGRSGFCRQIHRPGRSDRAPSSFGEVILPLAIQLLSGDDQAFAVRSTALVGAIGHHRHLER